MVNFHKEFRGWLGEAKVSCISHHWGIQLRLAYSWARPAILAAGKDRGGCFIVPSLFKEKRGDIVFGFPWFVVRGSEFIVGTL